MIWIIAYRTRKRKKMISTSTLRVSSSLPDCSWRIRIRGLPLHVESRSGHRCAVSDVKNVFRHDHDWITSLHNFVPSLGLHAIRGFTPTKYFPSLNAGTTHDRNSWLCPSTRLNSYFLISVANINRNSFSANLLLRQHFHHIYTRSF